MPEPKRPLKVFLCHASTDKPKVRELYRYLKRRGINPWFDEEHLVGGQDWQVEIPKALTTSDAIIICLTKNSVDKEGYIQKEIKFALDKALEMPEGRIFLIPVKFEECEVPFTLSRYQWVDLTIESGYSKMMKALKFRASQLERSIIDTSKQTKEENLGFEKVIPEKEKNEYQAAQKIAREKAEREVAEEEVRQRIINEKAERGFAEKNKYPSDAQSLSKIGWTIGVFGIIGIITIIALIGILYISGVFSSFVPSLTKGLLSTPTAQLPSKLTDSKGVEMVLVPANEFTMGSNSGNIDVRPLHRVYLDSYYIDKYEVTRALYSVCVDAGVCESTSSAANNFDFSYYSESEIENLPVNGVNWDMARIYCEWRGAQLPTEAEWEKAARGTDGRTYPWGDEVDCSFGNFCRGTNSLATNLVGSYESGKSPYGVYDMAGNVWEWVADWYLDKYYSTSPLSNPLGPEAGEFRVLRGGSWLANDDYVRAYYRHWAVPTNSHYSFGFRCSSNGIP